MLRDNVITPLTVAIAAFSHVGASRLHLSSRQASGAVEASDFLRRAYHSSLVLNRRLYIDGGEVSYRRGNATTYDYSNTLVSIDLNNDWTNNSVTLVSSPKPPGVPNLIHGGIWANRKTGILYTGFAGTSPYFGDQAFSPQGLWSFTPDVSAGGFWKSLNGSTDDWFTNQSRPYKGLVTSGRGYGFLLGGIVGNNNGTQPPPGRLITYDIPDKEVISTNTNSFAWGPFSGGRGASYNGTTFVPNWGNRGLLIAVGGGSQGRRGNRENTNRDPFQTIHVYDIDNDRWYEQQSTGTIPQARQDFCMAGSPSNNETHEILVYAGWNGTLGASSIPYDSAYVLTLPGFYWVKADYPAASPRHGLSCDAVSGSQIVTVGGVDTTQQDANDSYTAVFKTPDPFTQGLAIFDISSLSWRSFYQAQRGLQPPAPEIQAYYNTNGRAPENGFASPALQSLFAISSFPPTDPGSTTSGAGSPRARHDATAAIIGGTVGGCAAIGFATWALVWWHHRRQRRKRLRRGSEWEGGDGEGEGGEGMGAMEMGDVSPRPLLLSHDVVGGGGGSGGGGGYRGTSGGGGWGSARRRRIAKAFPRPAVVEDGARRVGEEDMPSVAPVYSSYGGGPGWWMDVAYEVSGESWPERVQGRQRAAVAPRLEPVYEVDGDCRWPAEMPAD